MSDCVAYEVSLLYVCFALLALILLFSISAMIFFDEQVPTEHGY